MCSCGYAFRFSFSNELASFWCLTSILRKVLLIIALDALVFARMKYLICLYWLNIMGTDRYRLVLSSDDSAFGGHDRVDIQTRYFSSPSPWNDRPNSLLVAVYFIHLMLCSKIIWSFSNLFFLFFLQFLVVIMFLLLLLMLPLFLSLLLLLFTIGLICCRFMPQAGPL